MTTAHAERLYEDDFYAWTRLQAKELRRFARLRPNLPLDLAHIAEEVADLGAEQRKRLRSRTRRIIEHQLLLDHSPARDPRRGWINEVVTFRREIDDHLSATLRRDLKRCLLRLYAQARSDLVERLRLYGESDVAARLPERCPYTLEQVLGAFWPASLWDAEASP